MSVDTTYIINQFARQKTLQVQMTNVPDTVNVSVANSDVYMDPISHIDSVVTHIDSITAQITQTISALAALTKTPTPTVSEPLTSIAIPLLVALIAMAAPLLLHNINGLDTKYHSTRVINLLKSSIVYKLFVGSVFFVGGVILLKAFTWHDNWSSWTFFAVSFLFLGILVWLCGIIVIFYSYPHLIRYVQKCYSSKCSLFKQKSLYFYALTDCLHYAIRQNDKEKSKELLTFFEERFKDFRRNIFEKKDYPQEFYDFVTETTEFICRKNYTNILYQDSEGGYLLPVTFLFPSRHEEDSDMLPSEKSYITIWKTLLTFCNYKHEELFLSYWDCINTYYTYKLPYNQANDFIEFHEYVGALLMAMEQYDVLHDLILWTARKKPTSSIFHFPRIVMTPFDKLIEINAEEIMLRYIRIMNVLDKADSKFVLPNIGATSEMPNPLKAYSQKYMALLYLYTCTPEEKSTYFTYDEGEDLKLPENITIQTIKNLSEELFRVAEALLSNELINNAFPKLKKIDTVPDLNHFVDAVQANFDLHIRIQDIKPKVEDAIHQIIENKLNEAFANLPFTISYYTQGKTCVSSEIHAFGFYPKNDLGGNDLKPKTRKAIENNTYCDVIRVAFDSFKKLKQKRQITCDRNMFLQSLNEVIATLRHPELYVLICEDSRIEDLFTDLGDEYEKKQYKGLDIIIATIHYSKLTKAQVWLVKKSDLPIYKILNSATEQDFHKYRYRSYNDNYHSQRLVLDLGRVTPIVLEQLRKEVPAYMLPENKSVEETVFIDVYLPLGIYSKASASARVAWTIESIPLYANQEDYPDDDYYEGPEDAIAAHIISPEEHNKAIESEKSKLRKNTLKKK